MRNVTTSHFHCAFSPIDRVKPPVFSVLLGFRLCWGFTVGAAFPADSPKKVKGVNVLAEDARGCRFWGCDGQPATETLPCSPGVAARRGHQEGMNRGDRLPRRPGFFAAEDEDNDEGLFSGEALLGTIHASWIL